MPLKFKLLLGRLFGWDKDLLRIVLFVIIFFAAALSAEWAIGGGVERLVWPEEQRYCDAGCQTARDQFIERFSVPVSNETADEKVRRLAGE